MLFFQEDPSFFWVAPINVVNPSVKWTHLLDKKLEAPDPKATKDEYVHLRLVVYVSPRNRILGIQIWFHHIQKPIQPVLNEMS